MLRIVALCAEHFFPPITGGIQENPATEQTTTAIHHPHDNGELKLITQGAVDALFERIQADITSIRVWIQQQRSSWVAKCLTKKKPLS